MDFFKTCSKDLKFKDLPEQNVEKDQFDVSYEGKITDLVEEKLNPNMDFPKLKVEKLEEASSTFFCENTTLSTLPSVEFLKTPPLPEYKIISLGYRCSVAGILKKLGLKHESFPFDWLVSRLPVIQHCIEDDFKEFFNLENYQLKYTHTFAHMNTLEGFVCNENMLANMYYQPIQNKDPKNAYQFNLAMNHHNIIENRNDYEYYKRCVERFQKEFASPTSKMFVHVTPLYTIDSYQQYGDIILKECYDFQSFLENKYLMFFSKKSVKKEEELSKFDTFIAESKDEFIETKCRENKTFHNVPSSSFEINCKENNLPLQATENGGSHTHRIEDYLNTIIRSLYFIMVLDNLETSPSLTILHEDLNNPKYKIYLLRTNHQFVDAGETFMGNYKEEQELIENCIRRFSI